jgi:glutamate-1-semialdehyde 2,1-aminomutase
MFERSQGLFARASAKIPGGVNSPVRAFGSVGGTPVFVERGEGAYFFDVDGNRYIDFVGSWGPLILGHNSKLIQDAAAEALGRGTSFGAPTEAETIFAELFSEILPSVEMLRVVNSGTEATMTAARLARGYTGRDYILKFDGCYHGHSDTFLVEAGSGVATCGIAGSPGIPKAVAETTLSIPFNDTELLRETIERLGADKLAAIIVEPVAGNMGLVLPNDGFLQSLRDICDKHGIVLIFDEVMCGFRIALGGAEERFGVSPDLSTFGKVIGGGFPVGALGGKREIMSCLAPSGPVYQAGTLSGNPLAMSVGVAVLSYLKDHNPLPELEERSSYWVKGMRDLGKTHSLPLQVNSCGSMIGMFFSEKPVTNFTEAKESNTERFKRFFHEMLNRGVYLAPSPFEAGFLSTCHTKDVIDKALEAADESLATLAK